MDVKLLSILCSGDYTFEYEVAMEWTGCYTISLKGRATRSFWR